MRVAQYIIGILFLSLYSCEKVIELDVEDAEQRIVIEGVLNDRIGDSKILLSKTGTVYDDSGFEKISGATVVVEDQDDMQYVFSENPNIPGRYELSTFQTIPNNLYKLIVIISGEEFTSECQTFSKPVIDSLTYLEQVGGFGPQASDTSYLVFYSFTDNPNETNFYRVKGWVNGRSNELFYLFNDELFNGNQYSAPFYGRPMESGDTVFAELISMDEANYTYLFTLANNANSGPFSASPANPVSNIEGNAIGYFGAFTTDTLSLIIP